MEVDYNLHCFKCKIIVPGGFKGFQHHLQRRDHCPPFVCGQGTCAFDFAQRKSLYDHVRVHHSVVPLEEVEDQNLDGRNDILDEDEDTDTDEAMQVDEEQQVSQDNMQQLELPLEQNVAAVPVVDLKRSAELAVLKLRSVTYMTGTAIQTVQEQAHSLMQDTAVLLKGKLEEFLSKSNRTDQDSQYLLEQFAVLNPFKHVKTKKQQLKVFKMKYNLIETNEIFLGHRYDLRQRSDGPSLETRQLPRSFQCVKMKDILQAVLQDPELRNMIMSEKASDDGYMRSFRDGSLFSKVPPDLQNAVRIIAYIDDLEILQALSPAAGCYKVAGIYFSIHNLPPEINSLLSHIYVTILAFSYDTRDELVWKPFLDSMRELETVGMEVIIDGQPVVFKAFLVALVADSAAASQVLGFRSSAANLFCRSCYINRKDMWRDGLLLGNPRTPEQHAVDVANSTTEANRKATGVDTHSMIHGLRFFEPVTHSVFDIFHDLLQGVCKMEIRLALRYFICVKKYFSDRDFNSRVQFFDYGFPDKKNKPRANFNESFLKKLSSYNLHQSGSQMWLLTRAFPFLCADLVPPDEPFMKLISLLNRIMTIVFSHAVCEQNLDLLEEVITEHHTVFQTIFPGRPENEPAEQQAAENEPGEQEAEESEDDPEADEAAEQAEHGFQDFDEDSDDEEGEDLQQPAPEENQQKRKKKRIVRMLNKHHHILHYLAQLRMFGPLVLYWCARHEARHFFFKLVATVCHNFINPLKTLMEMLQMKLASDKQMPRSRLIMGVRGTQLVTVDSTPHVDQLCSVGLSLLSKVYSVRSVTFNGIDYRSQLFVTLSLGRDYLHPKFARIQAQYVSENQDDVLLIVIPWKTIRFDATFCAYEVSHEMSEVPILVRTADLAAYRLLAIWKRYDSDKMYLAPRTVA